MFDLNDLFYFYLTAEHGGFTAAERHSGVTKSMLSRRIAKLEAQLHIRLIQRNSRQFALTSAGKILYQHAIEIMREQQEAWESLSEHVSEPTGLIRIGCPTVLAQYYLAPLLPAFMNRYPAVKVYLDATDRPVQIIEDGFDVVLKVNNEPEENPGLIIKPLVKNKRILVASPEYLLRSDMITCPDEITRLQTISSPVDSYEHSAKWHLVDTEGSAITIRHNPALICKNSQVQLEAAINGIGVALLPSSITANAIKDGRLVQLLDGWSTLEQMVYVLFPTRKHLVPAVRVFIDFLTDNFASFFHSHEK